jgi:hypothetical protein
LDIIHHHGFLFKNVLATGLSLSSGKSLLVWAQLTGLPLPLLYPEIGSSSIDCTQLSRLLLEEGEKSPVSKMFLNKEIG